MKVSANMIQNYLSLLNKIEGVYLADIPPATNEFESFYLGVRKSEKRLLSDDDVNGLPVLKNNPHAKEWEKRASSANRVNSYFRNKHSVTVLDLGCGNGWFTAMLAKNDTIEVLGMDVNLTELKQATRVFDQPNLSFVYGDIFQSKFPKNTFDFITINAVIQYFEDLDLLINSLFEILKPGGEIHFIDSPFYEQEELEGAKERTMQYYNKKGFPEMSQYYFHHSWLEIANFDPVVLYSDKSKSRILKFFKKPDMPFPWIKIVRKDG